MGHGSPDAAVEVVGLFWRDTESFAEMGRAGWTWAMQHLKAARVIGQSTDMYDAVAVVPSWTRLPAASSHSEGQA